MNVALITAGGIGSRMQMDVPKQFLTVYNKPLIIYTLEKFQNHPNIDSIVVTCLEGWEAILKAYAKQYKIDKLEYVVLGGKTGQKSIENGLKKIEKHYDEETIIVVHDGNRSFVSDDIISNSIVTCKEKGNAVTVIPCNEVIVSTEDQISSNKFLIRENLKRTQTPHSFYLKDLLWAHKEANKLNIDNAIASCDLFIKLGKEIYFSAGSEKNIKITTMDDIEIFKSLLSQKDREI